MIHGNSLTSLIDLRYCPMLLRLVCSSNELRSLLGIENCLYLRNLVCSRNQIESVTDIASCPQLRRVDCSRNRIGQLVGIEGCTQMQYFDCSVNRIFPNSMVKTYMLKSHTVYFSPECNDSSKFYQFLDQYEELYQSWLKGISSE